MMRLKIQEKILLHLYDYRKYGDRYEYPVDITQQGIADTIGISVTHVPRNIKKLVEEGLVYSKKGHVAGKKKRITVYLLTPKGIAEAKRIISELNNLEVEIGKERIKIGELRKILNLKYLELMTKLEKGEIKEENLRVGNRIAFKEANIKVDFFVDREKEMEAMKKWYSSGKFLCIIGGAGYGKTYLIQRFLDITKPNENLVWFDVYEGRKWSSIKEVLGTLFGNHEVLKILKNFPTILVFDGYFDVDDEFVSALNSLIKEDIGESKIIVSMRTDTPYYNRFYTLTDVVESRVQEIKLDAMPYKEARKILPDVKESSFKRIYQLSRGNPKILVALKNGDIDKIEVPLNREDVHLLKFLASQK